MSQREQVSFDQIDEFGPQTFEATFDVPSHDVANEDELAALGPIRIEAKADKSDRAGEYEIEGTVSITGDLVCSRCVEAYPFANTSPFHIRYAPRPEGSEGEEEQEVEISEGELDVEFYTERFVSLRDLAIAQIRLWIPMKPLCDDACLGLCLTCGTNRMREKCDCEGKAMDPRWSALKGLREDLASKNNN